MDSRVEREKSFHNKRFAGGKEEAERDEVPKVLAPFMPSFSILKPSLDRTYELIREHCPGSAVLDYGCSFGECSFYCLTHGAQSVTGIDISEDAIRIARDAATASGHANTRFEVMNAEQMTFADDEFDFACGFGIIHHLDVEVCAAELARVLKPGARAVFLEPLGHNPVINAYRGMTPGARTIDEHPLLENDFRILRKHFERVELQYFNLLTLPTLPVARFRGMQPVLRTLSYLDNRLFTAIPFFGRYAWNVVINASSPIRH